MCPPRYVVLRRRATQDVRTYAPSLYRRQACFSLRAYVRLCDSLYASVSRRSTQTDNAACNPATGAPRRCFGGVHAHGTSTSTFTAHCSRFAVHFRLNSHSYLHVHLFALPHFASSLSLSLSRSPPLSRNRRDAACNPATGAPRRWSSGTHAHRTSTAVITVN